MTTKFTKKHPGTIDKVIPWTKAVAELINFSLKAVK